VRQSKQRSRILITAAVVLVIIGGWWLWPDGDNGPIVDANGAAAESAGDIAQNLEANRVPVAVISDDPPVATRDEVLLPTGGAERNEPVETASETDEANLDIAGADSNIVEAPAARSEPEPETTPAANDDQSEQLSSNPRINASLQRYKAGQVIGARSELNRMLIISRDPAEQAELRRHLSKIADETIFSKTRRSDDPLIDTYTIESGDRLVNIGKQYNVPYEVIMLINGIKNASRIQEGQKLKVPRGPFNAKIDKSDFRLDVYLGDLYLRSFPVALGADQGTPEGKWIVKNRLSNPRYYPSASAEIKRTIAPDDPKNPLGEYWIGLEGVEGDAVGCVGYGIHGTIEPDSIGKAVSLGCIRMHNDDVEFLYKLMMPGQSTVTTLP
jgi:LysM repeat protein